MSAPNKLTIFLLLLGVAAALSYWGIRQHLRSRIDPAALGLDWMRQEYHLDDATYAKICKLHERYFAERQSMSSAIDAVERPIVSPTRSEKNSTALEQAAIKYEEELCDRYEEETIRHLQEVAALMKPEHGKRFLQDFATNVHQQRIEHQRALLERAQHD
ncbi:MAG: hypothetical protein RLZZ224_1382 [Verrucomicrobiota bacterium]|jgi:hypothetical protein